MIDPRERGHGTVVSRVALVSDDGGTARAPSRAEQDARFATLVREHTDFVWRVLRRLGLSASDADDATQRVFMIANSRLQSIEPRRERAFLYGTARRVLANVRRGERRRREDDASCPEDAVAEAPLPDALVERRRELAFLDDLLRRLPEPLRRVLVLSEIEQQSAPEIAAFEGIPVGTVASRLRRARAAFHALLAETQGDPARDDGSHR